MRHWLGDLAISLAAVGVGFLIGYGVGQPKTVTEIRVVDRIVCEPHYLYNEYILHGVKQGESLSSIAGHYYGEAGMWRIIAGANEDVVTGINMVYPYEVLRIPVWGAWQEVEGPGSGVMADSLATDAHFEQYDWGTP
jgi:hypothetical protein